jgi:hypothetical protein
VLPGFVAVLLKERIYEVRGEEATFDRLLTTVYYSLLIYLLVVTLRDGARVAGYYGRRSHSGYGTRRGISTWRNGGTSPTMATSSNGQHLEPGRVDQRGRYRRRRAVRFER